MSRAGGESRQDIMRRARVERELDKAVRREVPKRAFWIDMIDRAIREADRRPTTQGAGTAQQKQHPTTAQQGRKQCWMTHLVQ